MDLRLVVLAVACILAQCGADNMSCEEIKGLVDGHNARREKLAAGQVAGQPAASNMKYIVWDNELADKATKWASNNKFQHNPDRTIGSGRFTTGENIYTYGTTMPDAKLNVEGALKAWFNEHKDYHYKTLEASDFGAGPQTGHYTQMAWADTKYVGCGKSQYEDQGMQTFLVVCNYGPPGNFMGEYPYKTDGPKTGKVECKEEYCAKKYGDSC
nr:venom peptide [Acharia stimulea]